MCSVMWVVDASRSEPVAEWRGRRHLLPSGCGPCRTGMIVFPKGKFYFLSLFPYTKGKPIWHERPVRITYLSTNTVRFRLPRRVVDSRLSTQTPIIRLVVNGYKGLVRPSVETMQDAPNYISADFNKGFTRRFPRLKGLKP